MIIQKALVVIAFGASFVAGASAIRLSDDGAGLLANETTMTPTSGPGNGNETTMAPTSWPNNGNETTASPSTAEPTATPTSEPSSASCLHPGGNPEDNISGFLPGTCGDEATSDPRVFGPHLWKAFHMISVNFGSPPTAAAVKACTHFVEALPYMVPCAHCGWHLGEFIKFNQENSGKELDECMGAENESKCLSPSEACRSQEGLVSFFVRAHNNVNNNTNPCRARWTVADAYASYSKQENFCSHNIVWGTNQLCRGPYCSSDGSERCNQEGPKGTGFWAPGSESKDTSTYFGVLKNCSKETAEGCGSVQCS